MPTLDERVAYLEGRLEEHSASVGAVRNDVATMRGDVHDVRRQIDNLDQRLSSRMDALDAKTVAAFHLAGWNPGCDTYCDCERTPTYLKTLTV